MSNKLHGRLQIAIFLIIAVLFCYFRLKPLFLQSVGYTYDQGRDFLKAAEIVLYKNPTFIGPTTGIGGIFHGAWWYYILSFAFLVFQGLPIGFYFFIVGIQTCSGVLFGYVLLRRFGFLTSALLLTIIATSGHFIFTSIFIGNNVLAVPSVMLMAVATVLFIERTYFLRLKAIKLRIPTIFLAGLGLGFIAEFEFAFGLMVIPAYMLSMGLLYFFRFMKGKKTLRTYITSKPVFFSALFFFIGLAIPFIPRILFELKNGFPQTSVLWNFIVHPAYHTPKPFLDIYHDRVRLFQGYYASLYMSDLVYYLLTAILSTFILIRGTKKDLRLPSSYYFLCMLIVLLFLFSLSYKDTFWGYYYDGIQVLMVFTCGYILSGYTSNQFILDRTKAAVLAVLLLLSIYHLYTDAFSKYVYDGIKVQRDIVDYIQAKEKSASEYCVQIYTPPVIPYTYQYLFLYNQHANGLPQPKDNWIKKQCWFILEHDDNNERKDKWIADHIPEKAKQLSKKQIKDVSIELWKKTP